MAARNYQLGKLYKVINDVNDIEYYGSTAQKYLCRRMDNHRTSSKDLSLTTPFYEAIREIGVSHFKIVLIKKYPCGSKAELEAEEYRLIDEAEKAGKNLYNRMRAGGKHAPETIEKFKQRVGELNSVFDYGSVARYVVKQGEKQYPSWRFAWWEHGKPKSKYFAVKKYGGEGPARWMAEQYRKTVFPQYRSDEDLAMEAFAAIDWA